MVGAERGGVWGWLGARLGAAVVVGLVVLLTQPGSGPH